MASVYFMFDSYCNRRDYPRESTHYSIAFVRMVQSVNSLLQLSLLIGHPMSTHRTSSDA